MLSPYGRGAISTMKTALTIWGNRISPVFDSANTLLIVEIQEQKVCSRRYEPFYPHAPSRLAERLADLDIKVLICGAISELPANIIEFAGVQLIPFISGSVDEVLDAYARGAASVDTFLMPGCRCKGREQSRRGKKQRDGLRQIKEVIYMPRGDKTGPQGQGPGTGRGQGGCKTGSGGKNSGQGKGRDSSNKRGRGKGGGQGRGKGSGRQGA